MNRCLFRPLLSVSTALTMGVLALAATSSFNAAEAQSRRTFNDRAERGTIEFVSPPYVRLNGKDAQLSPGSRVYNPENRIVMANNVKGGKYTVRYLTDNMGQLGDVWILSQQEINTSSPSDKLKAASGGAPKYNGPVFQAGKPLSEQHQFKNEY